MIIKPALRHIGLILLLGCATLASAQTKSPAGPKDSATAPKNGATTPKNGATTPKNGATAAKDSAAAAKDTILNDIRTANDLKTGNWQDVFVNFFQLAATDLTSTKKSFSFQSTLFAVKSKIDSTILVDTNYIRHKLDRNLQFSFALGLDSNYQFHGFSGGITWAVVNKRDSTLISLVGTKADTLFSRFSDTLDIALRAYRQQFLDSTHTHFKSKDDSSAYVTAKDSLNKMLASSSTFDESHLPPDFKAFLVKRNFPTSDYDMVQKLYQQALAATRVKPLLTLALNSAFTKAAGFDSAQLGLVYLQGMTKTGKSLELDLRGKFIVKDSLVGADHYRSRLDASVGLDYALISSTDAKTKASISILEVKPYFEYNHLFSALVTGEKRDVVYAAAEFRLRITNSLWLPLTLKYDLSHKSFLGFLNVSFNMNSFSTPKKTAG